MGSCFAVRARERGTLVLVLATCAAALTCTSPATAAPIAITRFDGGARLQGGEVATAAGSHPYLERIDLALATTTTAAGQVLPLEDLKDLAIHLPAGLIANPRAVPPCPMPEFPNGCAPESQIGVMTIEILGEAPSFIRTPLYVVDPPSGTGALLGVSVSEVPVFLSARLPGGYGHGFTIETSNAQETKPIGGIAVELWGVPADPSHDGSRGECLGSEPPASCPSAEAADPKAFLTLPTSCEGPLATEVEVTGWQAGTDSASFLSHNTAEPPSPIGTGGCDAITFSPSLQARPTTNVADSPTGLALDVHVPQDGLTDLTGPAEGHLRSLAVTLPEGMAVNAAGANGLGACSPAQVGLLSAPGATQVSFSADRAQCPDDAKLGSAEALTPLLDHAVEGALYLATPFDNPFDSLLAVYLVLDDPQSGTVLKLAGELKPDEGTGLLTIEFDQIPQLPIEDLRLRLPSGPGAMLSTPATCGEYATVASLTPWSAPQSGPPAAASDGYQVIQAPGGGCAYSAAQMPNSPSLDAGSVSPLAGADSRFVVDLRREDGSQRLRELELTLPAGVSAQLRGIPICPDSALATIAATPGTGRSQVTHPSCPPGSRVGDVSVAAGAGPQPYFLNDGSAYLAGPHDGAPFSIAVVVPALVGPFDLGTVLVRLAVYVDPNSARLRGVSDPLPARLSGIPLDLRRVRIDLSRPGFIRNPTSCDETSIAGSATSASGAVAPLRVRFQVGGCASLGFKPRVSLALSGALARNAHPTITAGLAVRAGDANIAGANFTLPAGELLDFHRIRALCARALAPQRCPRASRLGHARLLSPQLPEALQGPIYLRAPSHRYPDLLAELRTGQLHVLLHGRTAAAPGGRLQVRFTGLPDLPLARAAITLAGGRGGIFVNSEALCARPRRATVSLSAHNGKRRRLRPPLRLRGRC